MKARSRPSLLNADNAICAIGELPWVTSKELAHGRVKSVRDQALGVRRSVGAGDRFNARLFIGLLLGLDAAERLMLGCASSGYYVRNAASATWPDLLQFLRQWGEHLATQSSSRQLP